MRYKYIVLIAIIMIFGICGSALAAWPESSQGDQYTAVNSAMEAAAADSGISSETFISIYNDAIVGGLSTYSDSQLDAACSVLSRLESYKSVLSDYDTVYSKLDCSTRLSASGLRGKMPSTGMAAILLLGAGVVVVGTTLVLKRRPS